jgi:NADH-quinone oxidoreductase subunit H
MNSIVQWILDLPAWVWITIVAHLLVLGTVAYLILLERKVASWVQDRIGPNRVGLGFGIIPVVKNWKMWGLGQPLADGLKFIVKEDYGAKGVDRVLFTLAPIVMIIVVIISIAVVPMGGLKAVELRVVIGSDVERPLQSYTSGDLADRVKAELPPGANIREVREGQQSGVLKDGRIVPPAAGEQAHTYLVADVVYNVYHFQIADLNVGVLFILAALSLAVYGVVIGGWASNNKYSFLGGLRATANMISYEIPLGLAVLCIVVMFGTLNLETIVEQQATYWGGWIPAWNVFC